MTDWIEWNGGECPIKSHKTRVEYKLKDGCVGNSFAKILNWTDNDRGYDIIAYRITEDHEPMTQTREQITAQIEALQKQLDALPVVVVRYYGLYRINIEIINGVPHIHGVALKEVTK